MKKSIIGITPWFDYDKGLTYIKDGYFEGILESGGIAVLLPLTCDTKVLEEIVTMFDGFLLSGGPDVDPQYYGEGCLVYNGQICPRRDYMEVFLSRKALSMNKPVFGICRGMQILNVAFDGTLYQDIEQQINGKVTLKHLQSAPNWHPTHDIFIEEDSRLFESLGVRSLRVNSFHHQAVKNVAAGFKVTSRSPDNIIESIETCRDSFALGVQWHPEKMWQKDATQLKLFSAFVAECAG